jgi:dethiobiotin synthetase
VKPLFITATGTEIGKTVVTAALIGQARAAGRSVAAIKPLISGYSDETFDESDTAVLLKSLGREATPEAADALSPWRYAAPLAPDMAAAREGKTVDFNALIAFCHDEMAGPEELLLIEGVGGLMVPLTRTETVLDWIKALDIPALLVAGSYLGTISHTLTALETAEKHGVAIAGIVLSESSDSPVPLAETAADIARLCPRSFAAAPILELPRLADAQEPWRDAPDLLGALF